MDEGRSREGHKRTGAETRWVRHGQKAQRLRKKGRARESRDFSLREDHRPSYVLLPVTLLPPTQRRILLASSLLSDLSVLFFFFSLSFLVFALRK